MVFYNKIHSQVNNSTQQTTQPLAKILIKQARSTIKLHKVSKQKMLTKSYLAYFLLLNIIFYTT